MIHESHQDCVTELPEGSIHLASSGDTRVEVWAYGDHVLCIQGKSLANMSESFAPCIAPHLKGTSLSWKMSLPLDDPNDMTGSPEWSLVYWLWRKDGVIGCSCLNEELGSASAEHPAACLTALYLHAGHPEFSREFMEALVRWKAQATPDTFPTELAEAAIAELRQDAVSSKDIAIWHRLCKACLKAPGLRGAPP